MYDNKEIKLNGISMNQALKMIKEYSDKDVLKRFVVECDEVILTILTASHMNSSRNQTVEVGFNYIKDGKRQFIPIDMDENGKFFYDKDGNDNHTNLNIIHCLPIITIPTLLGVCKHIELEDTGSVVESLETLSNYYNVS